MNRIQKLLSLLLVLLMLVGMVGCQNPPETTGSQSLEQPGTSTPATQPSATTPTQTTPPTTPPTVPPTTAPKDPEAPANVPPVYELTQEDVDEYYRLLGECETLALAGEDLTAIENAFDALDALHEFLFAQNSVASILYYSNMKDQALTDQHLGCMDICTEANSAYIQMTRRVYLSDTPAKEMLFEGWSEQDIAYLLSYSDEVVQLNKRISEITVEYQNTRDDNTKIELYKEMVTLNNQIAQLSGYENYYEYASKLICHRDYTTDQIEQMRGYAKEYMADLYKTAIETYRKNYGRLSSVKQNSVDAFLTKDYTSIRADHIGNYLAVMPDAMEAHILTMIREDSLFTKEYGAMAGAFTTTIGERSYCFFGPGYANLATVVHEGGHYYASQYNDLSSLPLDLAETHSQANEWLFFAYLDGKFAANEYQCVLDYRFCSDLSTILSCLMIDEFEQKVYSSDVSNFTSDDFDAIMDGIVTEYFDLSYSEINFADMNSYWRLVVVDHPVYYLSYAVSAVAAIDLYTVALEDFAGATEIYRKLCEEPVLEAGFLGNITAAGLSGPFDESFYLELQAIINSRK